MGHPHACGELFSSMQLTAIWSGSSPRLWGTPPEDSLLCPDRRFIPTLVGNSKNLTAGIPECAVHPHACGELQILRCLCRIRNGSSPRLWGTLQDKPPNCPEFRFIPTLVGNSVSRASAIALEAVHPHACGELSGQPPRVCMCTGSSPRLWGTQDAHPCPGNSPRFIPTLVGNSPTPMVEIYRSTVHPHACGELYTNQA